MFTVQVMPCATLAMRGDQVVNSVEVWFDLVWFLSGCSSVLSVFPLKWAGVGSQSLAALAVPVDIPTVSVDIPAVLWTFPWPCGHSPLLVQGLMAPTSC